jgi:hypothetical protein
MGEPIHLRSVERFASLVKPWQPDELGFRTMEEWHGMPVEMTPQEQMVFTEGTFGYGVFLVK